MLTAPVLSTTCTISCHEWYNVHHWLASSSLIVLVDHIRFSWIELVAAALRQLFFRIRSILNKVESNWCLWLNRWCQIKHIELFALRKVSQLSFVSGPHHTDTSCVVLRRHCLFSFGSNMHKHFQKCPHNSWAAHTRYRHKDSSILSHICSAISQICPHVWTWVRAQASALQWGSLCVLLWCQCCI